MKRMNNKYLVIDVALCHDCNNCFIACKDEHVANDWFPYAASQPRHGHRWMNIHRLERGKFPCVDVAFLPQPCMHCRNAPCMDVSDGNVVYRRDDGIVIIDPKKAKGRKDLVDKCPYGAIYWNEELQLPQKCTFCAHLLDDGYAMPRCAHSCPTGAINFYDMSEAEMEAMILKENLQCFQDGLNTRPNVFYKNRHRFEADFVAGSLEQDGECLEGVEVILHGPYGAFSQMTDFLGEFKFDGLLPGKYTIFCEKHQLAGFSLKKGGSISLGTLEPDIVRKS